MKRPDPTFQWRGITFDWTLSARAYIADTHHGRWTIQRHVNDDSQWFARFGPYAGNWASSPGEALGNVLLVAMMAHQRALDYLRALP